MKLLSLFQLASVVFFLDGCATPQQAPVVRSGSELRRITQFDLTSNRPIESWNARADTIQQHVRPPVGITFTEATTGRRIHFNGTYRIESYRALPRADSGKPSTSGNTGGPIHQTTEETSNE